MMNGIEVLNESYIVKGSEYACANELLIIFLIFAVLFFIGIIFGLVAFKRITEIIAYIITILSLVSIIGLCVYSEQPSDIKQYQVTISDDVSMVEFNEKYDAIDVEGKIWTIVEKE